MQAGKLDRQVSLLRYSETPDTSGGITEAYTSFATVWASVKDLRGTQFIAAQQTNNSITTKFTIRFRTDLTGKDRIGWNGREYDIIGAPIELGRNEALEIMAKARDE